MSNSDRMLKRSVEVVSRHRVRCICPTCKRRLVNRSYTDFGETLYHAISHLSPTNTGKSQSFASNNSPTSLREEMAWRIQSGWKACTMMVWWAAVGSRESEMVVVQMKGISSKPCHSYNICILPRGPRLSTDRTRLQVPMTRRLPLHHALVSPQSINLVEPEQSLVRPSG